MPKAPGDILAEGGGGGYRWKTPVNFEFFLQVFFTVNLREIFACPFIWAQMFAICIFLDRNASRWRVTDPICRISILIFTFLFSLMWQFNQFVLLIQALSIYGKFGNSFQKRIEFEILRNFAFGRV